MVPLSWCRRWLKIQDAKNGPGIITQSLDGTVIGRTSTVSVWAAILEESPFTFCPCLGDCDKSTLFYIPTNREQSYHSQVHVVCTNGLNFLDLILQRGARIQQEFCAWMPIVNGPVWHELLWAANVVKCAATVSIPSCILEKTTFTHSFCNSWACS